MLGDLTGKTVFVTGGGQGIGRGIVRVMAGQGADVLIADIAAEAAEEAAREVEQLGRKARVVQIDVASPDSVRAAVQQTLHEWQRVDILVNNAGVPSAPGGTGEVDREEDWDVTFGVNVKGPVHCCEELIPHMKEHGYGRIINIASMAGHAPRRSGGAYGASKAAVLRYTKGLAFSLAPHNITVNAICPGAVWTPFQQRGVRRRQQADPRLAERDPYDIFVERYAEVIPMGRPQTPEDIGKVAAFLASDDASNITGQCIHVDGGAILRD